MSNVMLGYHKLYGFVRDPEMATPGSACFDLRSYFGDKQSIECIDPRGHKVTVPIVQAKVDDVWCNMIDIPPKHTAKIPTGLIFEIPHGYAVKVYGRSGLSMRGLPLANSVGIIDSDYREEIFILLRNVNDSGFVLKHDDRVAQMNVERVCATNLVEISDKPDRIGTRSGGFGSTGVN
tara:strand:- start:1651 stop:2184 length:534 start_codon:yes stop_codon:yes gene_type:complete